MKKLISLLCLIFISSFCFLIILKPEICINSAISGVLICGNIIIPSIYPFTFGVLFINNSGVLGLLKPLNKVTNKLFGLNYYEFAIFLLSLIGGYPLGAKLLSEKPSPKNDIMINFCINAGPAFIILAVGKGVFKSSALGWVLYTSHIMASLLIMLFLSGKTKKYNTNFINKKPLGCVENFTQSASDAANTVIKICGLVILFSTITAYLKMLFKNIKPLYFITLLCEVTNAVFTTKNILLISFLLGFAGLSIWAQVFSLLKYTKINYLRFVFFRILHGCFSAFITLVLLNSLKLSVSTLSNNINFNYKLFINGPTVAFSLIIMGIVLIISLYNKKFAGNIIEDIV
ncbi:MAG: hypothetical protein J6B80_06135 [Clostridia bacterium]|nr:hypothetical protein [Clostridia bacterium]